MDPEFWHERWAANEIGFHKDTEHDLLVRHLGRLALPPGARLFLPLCGKTLDMAWLMGEGYRVVGCELSPVAVTQFFETLGVVPEISSLGPLGRYAADGIELLCGDIFDLGPELLGAVDAVYDRAALVALPPPMRSRYVPHLDVLAGPAPRLLVTISYAPGALPGPPFSLSETEVRALFEPRFTVEACGQAPLVAGAGGGLEIVETLWHLSPGR